MFKKNTLQLTFYFFHAFNTQQFQVKAPIWPKLLENQNDELNRCNILMDRDKWFFLPPWISILSHCLTCPTSSGVLHGVSHKIIHHHFLCWYLELDSILALISFSYFCIFRDLSDFICQRTHTVCPFSVDFLLPLFFSHYDAWNL